MKGELLKHMYQAEGQIIMLNNINMSAVIV
jgi:hypothetical protein